MPIVINLDVMLAKRKMSLTELSNELGLTMTNLSLIKTGKVKNIRLETLDQICRVLDCKPGDLFDYEPDESDDKPLDWVTDDR